MLFVFVFVFIILSCLFLKPCGNLLGKGLPLGFLVCFVFLMLCHSSIWCHWSGVVLDCIESCYLPSYLLCIKGLIFPPP